MVFQVTQVEKATQNYPKRIYIVAEFATKAEAEAWRRTEDPFSQISVGVREKPAIQRPVLETGEEFIGEPLGKPAFRTTTRSPQEQAAIEAKARSLADINREIQRTTGEERTRLIQQRKSISDIPTRDVDVRRVSTAAAQLEQMKESERQRRVAETTAKIERAKTPTTRQEFAASLFERQKKKVTITDKELRVVSPGEEVVLRGGREVIAKGRVTGVEFKPVFIEQIGTGKPVKIISKPPMRVITGFEERVTRLEKAEAKFFQLPFFKVTEKISRVIPGEGFVSKTGRLVVKGILDFPVALPGGLFFGTQKAIAIGEAAIKPQIIKADIGRELLRTGKETLISFDPTKPAGAATFVTAGLFAFLGVLPKGAKAKTILREAAKEKPPRIKGEQFFGLRRTIEAVRTTEKITTPKVTITKPSKFVTAKRIIDIPKPTIAVAKGKGIFSVTLPTGKQITTQIRTFRGKPAFIRSVTEPGGKTVSKVFLEDVLLKKVEFKAEPVVKFTEPLRQVKKVETVEQVTFPSRRTEVVDILKTSKVVSAITRGKFEPVGARVLRERAFLDVIAETQKVEALGKVGVDITPKGVTKRFLPEKIRVFDTQFEFVKFPPKQKPLIFEFSREGLFFRRPVVAKTFQTPRIRAPFEIEFIKRVKRKPFEKPKIKKERKKLTDVEKRLLKEVERRGILRETESRKITEGLRLDKRLGKIESERIRKATLKEKQIEKVKIERPTGKITELPKDFKLFIPEPELITRGFRPVTAVVPVGVVAQIPSERVITQPRIKQKPIESNLLRQFEKQSQRSREVTKERQKSLERQRELTKQRELTRQRELTKQREITKQVDLTKQEEIVKQIELTKQQELTRELTLTPSRAVEALPKTVAPPPPKVPILLPILPSIKGARGKRVPAFETEVKKSQFSKEFIRLPGSTLPRNRAINRGAKFTDSFAQRTFRIKRVGTTTTPDIQLDPILKQKFRGRKQPGTKLPPKVFVEKSRFALDSPFEKEQIIGSPLRVINLRAAAEKKAIKRQIVPRVSKLKLPIKRKRFL